MDLRVKRVYDDPAEADGFRVLVDRLWPRGLSKERARVDEWCKQVAPSEGLRTDFHHGGLGWTEFERRYRTELQDSEHVDAVAHLRELVAGRDTVTLLHGAKDCEHNNARVLAQVLDGSTER